MGIRAGEHNKEEKLIKDFVLWHSRVILERNTKG